jgi:hypothetical protein
MSNVFLQAALSYAARGWHVFPCHPHSKIPATAHGFKEATIDPELIKEWWQEDPAYNVAIATGEISGLFVLDVDEKPGRTLEDALAGFPALPDCPTVRTGGGGLQFFFSFPQGSTLSISGGKLGIGIDTRGNGGYVVAPPSIHDKTGRAYEFIDSDDFIEHGQVAPPVPSWIEEKLKNQRTAAKSLGAKQIKGGRHQALLTAAGLMRGNNFAPAEIEAALKAMVARLDLSDGRVITDKEISDIAAWTADKATGNCTIESVLHGNAIVDSLSPRGEAVTELIESSSATVKNPGAYPAFIYDLPGVGNMWMSYIESVCKRSQPELALGAVLTAMGALIGQRLCTQEGSRANLYVFGLCDSGGGKDAALRAIDRVVELAGAGDLMGSGDLASDTGLISELEHSPCRLLLIDEIGKLIGAVNSSAAGAHLKGISSALLKLYSSAGEIYRGKAYADRSKNVKIYYPHVCIYGTATPEATWEALGSGSVEDGFLGRAWVFQALNNLPARKRVDRHAAPPTPPQDLILLLRKWYKEEVEGGALETVDPRVPVCRRVIRTEGAHAVFDEFILECDEHAGKLRQKEMILLWTRAAQKADQLSLIHAWSEAIAGGYRLVEIPERSAKWACDASRYLTQSLLYNAAQYIANGKLETDIKSMLRYIGSTFKAGASKSEVYLRFQRLGKQLVSQYQVKGRSEERRVGKECRSRWSPYH